MMSRSVLFLGLFFAVAGACSVYEEPDSERRFDDDGVGAAGAVTTTGGAASTSNSTGMMSSSTSAGGATPGSASTGAGASLPCNDPYDEPNDSQSQATDLGAVSDCTSLLMLDGVLDGNDVDWFTYSGSDDAFCFVNPSRELSTQGGQARVCKFVACDGLELTCPAESSYEESPQGTPGCCSLTGFELSVDCSGISDDATVWIRIDKPATFACVEYSFSYQY